jgi:hypothetical protein
MSCYNPCYNLCYNPCYNPCYNLCYNPCYRYCYKITGVNNIGTSVPILVTSISGYGSIKYTNSKANGLIDIYCRCPPTKIQFCFNINGNSYNSVFNIGQQKTINGYTFKLIKQTSDSFRLTLV